ncbi:unnamed protein product, partial [Pylaiella littoralis]
MVTRRQRRRESIENEYRSLSTVYKWDRLRSSPSSSPCRRTGDGGIDVEQTPSNIPTKNTPAAAAAAAAAAITTGAPRSTAFKSVTKRSRSRRRRRGDIDDSSVMANLENWWRPAADAGGGTAAGQGPRSESGSGAGPSESPCSSVARQLDGPSRKECSDTETGGCTLNLPPPRKLSSELLCLDGDPAGSSSTKQDDDFAAKPQLSPAFGGSGKIHEFLLPPTAVTSPASADDVDGERSSGNGEDVSAAGDGTAESELHGIDGGIGAGKSSIAVRGTKKERQGGQTQTTSRKRRVILEDDSDGDDEEEGEHAADELAAKAKTAAATIAAPAGTERAGGAIGDNDDEEQPAPRRRNRAIIDEDSDSDDDYCAATEAFAASAAAA